MTTFARTGKDLPSSQTPRHFPSTALTLQWFVLNIKLQLFLLNIQTAMLTREASIHLTRHCHSREVASDKERKCATPVQNARSSIMVADLQQMTPDVVLTAYEEFAHMQDHIQPNRTMTSLCIRPCIPITNLYFASLSIISS